MTLVLSADAAPEDAKTLAQHNSQGEENAATVVPQIAFDSPQQPQKKQPLNNQPDSIDILDSPYSEAKINHSDSTKQLDPQTRQALIQESILALNTAENQIQEKTITRQQAKESKYVPYIENLRLKIENVGTLNYPEQARLQQIEGELVVSLAINDDGTIKKFRILRSSGAKVLDDAARRIAHFAAPFDPFPDDFNINVLPIPARTWVFGQDRITTKDYQP